MTNLPGRVIRAANRGLPYGVLLSNAETLPDGQPRVEGPYESFRDALDFASSASRNAGVDTELMRQHPEGWRSLAGEEPVDVVRRRWGS